MRQWEVDSRSMSVDRKALDKCFESYCGVHNRIINLSQQVGVLVHVSGPRPAISLHVRCHEAPRDNRRNRMACRCMLILKNKIKKPKCESDWKIYAGVRPTVDDHAGARKRVFT